MSKKRIYSIETKLKAVELKQKGYSAAYMMNELQIKNKTQIQTWCRWVKQGQAHRLYQLVGQQYTYQKGVKALSELEQAQLRIQELEMENEILGKLKGMLGG